MKTYVKKTALISFVAAGLLLFSCSNNDDSGDDGSVNFSAENTARAAQADNVVEGSFNIMESGYVEVEEGRSNSISLFPNCTEIAITPDGNGGGTILLDFGDGCQLNNGAQVTGSILLEYGPIDGGTRTINYTYQSFTYNNNAVTGGGVIVRTIANYKRQSTIHGHRKYHSEFPRNRNNCHPRRNTYNRMGRRCWKRYLGGQCFPYHRKLGYRIH